MTRNNVPRMVGMAALLLLLLLSGTATATSYPSADQYSLRNHYRITRRSAGQEILPSVSTDDYDDEAERQRAVSLTELLQLWEPQRRDEEKRPQRGDIEVTTKGVERGDVPVIGKKHKKLVKRQAPVVEMWGFAEDDGMLPSDMEATTPPRPMLHLHRKHHRNSGLIETDGNNGPMRWRGPEEEMRLRPGLKDRRRYNNQPNERPRYDEEAKRRFYEMRRTPDELERRDDPRQHAPGQPDAGDENDMRRRQEEEHRPAYDLRRRQEEQQRRENPRQNENAGRKTPNYREDESRRRQEEEEERRRAYEMRRREESERQNNDRRRQPENREEDPRRRQPDNREEEPRRRQQDEEERRRAYEMRRREEGERQHDDRRRQPENREEDPRRRQPENRQEDSRRRQPENREEEPRQRPEEEERQRAYDPRQREEEQRQRGRQPPADAADTYEKRMQDWLKMKEEHDRMVREREELRKKQLEQRQQDPQRPEAQTRHDPRDYEQAQRQPQRQPEPRRPDAQAKSQEDLENERKLQEYIRRNTPINLSPSSENRPPYGGSHVTPGNHRDPASDRIRENEQVRRAEHERRLEEERRRKQVEEESRRLAEEERMRRMHEEEDPNKTKHRGTSPVRPRWPINAASNNSRTPVDNYPSSRRPIPQNRPEDNDPRYLESRRNEAAASNTRRPSSETAEQDEADEEEEELKRLKGLPVRATIIVRPTDTGANRTSTPPPPPALSLRFGEDIDFPGISPSRRGPEVARFPAPVTKRPPMASPQACVWAIVVCCQQHRQQHDPNQALKITRCFEATNCPGASWDTERRCSEANVRAANGEIKEFYVKGQQAPQRNREIVYN